MNMRLTQNHNLGKDFWRVQTEVQIMYYTCLSRTGSLRTLYEGHSIGLPELYIEMIEV